MSMNPEWWDKSEGWRDKSFRVIGYLVTAYIVLAVVMGFFMGGEMWYPGD